MMSIGAMIGESLWQLQNSVVRMGDGSWIAVQLDAPSFTAGQVLTGKVVASIMTPVVCDDVSVIVELEEATYWDSESSHVIHEGHGEHRHTRTVWTHATHQHRGVLFREVVRVAALPSLLPAGMWQYPFSYQIPPQVPGVLKFRKAQSSRDPNWGGRMLETRAEVNFALKAVLCCRGVFSNELRSSQEIVVNPLFDYAKMQPAHAAAAGAVVVCCCFNKGALTLNSACDKGAYQGGEVMKVMANVKNDSTVALRKMSSKLVRTVLISDGAGAAHRMVDVIARADYEGGASQERGASRRRRRRRRRRGPAIPPHPGPPRAARSARAVGGRARNAADAGVAVGLPPDHQRAARADQLRVRRQLRHPHGRGHLHQAARGDLHAGAAGVRLCRRLWRRRAAKRRGVCLSRSRAAGGGALLQLAVSYECMQCVAIWRSLCCCRALC